jgi:hypothetical protein
VSPALLRDGWRHRRPVAEGGNEAATQVWRTNSEEVLIAIPVHRTYQRIDPADQFGGRMVACSNPPIEVWARGDGDAVRLGRCGIRLLLDRDLDVVEAGVGEFVEPLVGDADARGDEIGVEAGAARRRHDVNEIAPRRRLAAGEATASARLRA